MRIASSFDVSEKKVKSMDYHLYVSMVKLYR